MIPDYDGCLQMSNNDEFFSPKLKHFSFLVYLHLSAVTYINIYELQTANCTDEIFSPTLTECSSENELDVGCFVSDS